MSAKNTERKGFKEKAKHEFVEMAIVFAYLAFVFCALATYSMLLLERYEIAYFTYGAALLNALIITKVILIGEAVHFGKRHEGKALVYSVIYKAFLYGVLVFAFHLIEETVKLLIHGRNFASAFHEVRLDDVLARSIVIFGTFIPFFGFRELGRVIGPEKMRDLFCKSHAAKAETPARI
jgi:hypothetical protein